MIVRRIITILILIFVIGLFIGLVVFFVNQNNQSNDPSNIINYSRACNRCYNGTECTSLQDWKVGWFAGCTQSLQTGALVKNQHPDIDNTQTSVAESQGQPESPLTEVNRRVYPNTNQISFANGVYSIIYPDGSVFEVNSAVIGTDAATQIVTRAAQFGSRAQFLSNESDRTGIGLFQTSRLGLAYKLLIKCPDGTTESATSCNENLYAGTLNSGNVCCVSNNTVINNCTQYDRMVQCQSSGCGSQANDCQDLFTNSPTAAIPIVDSCSNAPAGARTKCESAKQRICDLGSDLQVTDYCMVVNNVDKTGRVVADNRLGLQNGQDCSSIEILSDSEGGNFIGCSVTGQACTCDDGKAVCREETPDKFGRADTCPQLFTNTIAANRYGGEITFRDETGDNSSGNKDDGSLDPLGCLRLDQRSPELASRYSTGQSFVYTAQFRCNSLNNGLRLAVLSEDDKLSGTPNLVSPNTSDIDQTAGICTYTFNWKATGLTNGLYSVKLLEDGTTSTMINTPACSRALYIDSTATEQPTFSIVKNASYTCSETGSVITYRVTVTNIGNVSAQLDFVRDDIPGRFNANSGSVFGFSPAPTNRTQDTITWNYNKILAPEQSVVITYKIQVTPAQINAIGNSALANSVVAQFGENDSTVQFENRIRLNCLPDTSIFSDNPVLILGILLILFGIVVNRTGTALRLFGIDTDLPDSDGTSNFMDRFTPKVNHKDIGARFMTYEEKVIYDRESKRSK